MVHDGREGRLGALESEDGGGREERQFRLSLEATAGAQGDGKDVPENE